MKCKVCGKKADSEYCFQHKPKKTLKRTISMIDIMRPYAEKQAEIAIKLNGIAEQAKVFLDIWRKRHHISEISGEYLGDEPLTIFFHHILPKEKYPEANKDEENIILLTFDEHGTVENDIYRYEEINKRREKLTIKYKL